MTRKALPCLVAIAAGLVVLVPAAEPYVQHGGGYTFVIQTIKVPASKSKTLTATCPKGTHALGGGEQNQEPYNSVFLRQTYPFDGADKDKKPDDGWRTRVQNREAHKVSVNTQAVCGKELPKYVVVRFLAPSGLETGQETASCPPETFVYAGGMSAPAKSNVAINATFPNPMLTGATEWGGYLDNRGSQAEDNAAVIAVCGTVQPEIVQTMNVPTDPHKQRQLSAHCLMDTYAFSAGLVNSTGFKGLAINSLGPKTAADKPGERGMGIADTIGGSMVDITVAAVCGLAA
jgi:hypothetical protein